MEKKMIKTRIRKIILNNFLLRELFFVLGKRKVNLNFIDKKISNNKINLSEKVIEDCVISLTSYGNRISEMKYTLFSLINQTIRPYKIVVNIAEKDTKMIDENLLWFKKYGVEFNFCEDLRSFKKLIPTMQLYSDKTIVTVDDDMYYERNFLESLWNKHIEYPEMIVAHNIYEITFNNGKINTYISWPHSVITHDISFKNFFVGCGGVLYPPHSLYEDYDKKDLYQKLTPIADDIWFYFMAYLKGTKVTQPDKPQIKFHYVNPYREYGISDGKTLTQENVGLGRNDEQFRNVLSHYKITEFDFIKSLQCK